MSLAVRYFIICDIGLAELKIEDLEKMKIEGEDEDLGYCYLVIDFMGFYFLSLMDE